MTGPSSPQAPWFITALPTGRAEQPAVLQDRQQGAQRGRAERDGDGDLGVDQAGQPDQEDERPGRSRSRAPQVTRPGDRTGRSARPARSRSRPAGTASPRPSSRRRPIASSVGARPRPKGPITIAGDQQDHHLGHQLAAGSARPAEGRSRRTGRSTAARRTTTPRQPPRVPAGARSPTPRAVPDPGVFTLKSSISASPESADGGAGAAMVNVPDFDTLYRADPDPWGVASSFYERRKLRSCSPPSSPSATDISGTGTGRTPVDARPMTTNSSSCCRDQARGLVDRPERPRRDTECPEPPVADPGALGAAARLPTPRARPSELRARDRLGSPARRTGRSLSWSALVEGLLQVGVTDIPLGRLVEGHVDALRILGQAGSSLDPTTGTASGPPGPPAPASRPSPRATLRLNGTIRFASGAGSARPRPGAGLVGSGDPPAGGSGRRTGCRWTGATGTPRRCGSASRTRSPVTDLVVRDRRRGR